MYRCELCDRKFNCAGNLSNHMKYTHKIIMTKLEEILVENSTYKNTNRLKDWIAREGLLKYECSECKIGPTWNGKLLRLQLDHINGVNNDNRLENLRILCPNCHTQTENYSARNIKKKTNAMRIFERSVVKTSDQIDMKTLKHNSKQKEINDIIVKIINSDIDFSKQGWVNETSKIIGISPQKVTNWMRRNMYNFWNKKCFKRKGTKFYIKYP